MILWLKKPKSIEVAKYVDCYWLLEKQADAKGNEYPKLNPDPSAHLILSPPEQPYNYKFDNKKLQGKGSHLLYPYCNTIQLDHSQPLKCLGIKFHVGALYALNHVKTAKPLLDTIDEINIEKVFGITQASENKLLTIAKDKPEGCCELLDELLKPWLLKGIEDRHSELTNRVLPLLASLPIHKLSDELNCSQRTIERSFLRVAGMSLKQCQSMNKLEEILEYLYLREKGDIDWVDIACQFGFSDQPHLIRYLKKQLNLTPKDYAQQRGFTIDIYGGVETK